MPTPDTVTPVEIIRALFDLVGMIINGGLLLWASSDLIWVMANGRLGSGQGAVAYWHVGTEVARFIIQCLLMWEAWLQLITPNVDAARDANAGDIIVNAAVVVNVVAGIWAMYWRVIVGRYVQARPVPSEATMTAIAETTAKYHDPTLEKE